MRPPLPTNPRVKLRPLHPGDEHAIAEWRLDTAFCLANGWSLDLSGEQVREYWRRIIAEKKPDQLIWAIEVEERFIGHVDLAHLTPTTAELGIALGESALWGRGLGAQAAALMLRHAFENLKLAVVTAEVHSPNQRSHALMRKFGFEELGCRGEEEYQGEVVPMVHYQLTAAAFRQGQGRALIPPERAP